MKANVSPEDRACRIGRRVACRQLLAILFVCVFAIVDRHDADDAFALVNAIEETELAYSVPPSVRSISLEFLDVGSVVGLLFDLWIDVFLELGFNKPLLF